MAETATLVKDGTDMSFMADVIEASKEVPVIVDFWAPWCGPCKQLMPRLEKKVKEADGGVRLVKINTQEQQGVAGQLGVRSIPAVYAFKDGQPVDGFMGAVPDSELDSFIGRLTGAVDPKEEAAALVERARGSLTAGDPGGAAQDFAQALQLDAENGSALAGLARIYLDMGDRTQAEELIGAAEGKLADHPEVASLRSELALTENTPISEAEAEESPDVDPVLEAAKAAVAANPKDLDAKLALAKLLAAKGDRSEAVDQLIESVAQDRKHDDEAARKFLLTIFEAEGPESEISIEGRRRLASLLYA
ncbi:MAG: tetratricopeptide repeat protein [Pseudomonadota bacterium]